ncbi:neural proliferation differentiation and control protein 1-like [Eucyclogobius newberryi]|uniref:neural proliferation differentiation and control protein 1-like n=1 Tax=Eucyclogobius newberryi TaxID=166745 RepID=UPI003B59E454
MSEQRSEVTLYAPPSQTSPSPTETATNHSSLAPPTAVTNHSSALLSAVSKPHPLSDNSVFIVMSSVFIVTGSIALMIAGACWVSLQRALRLSQEVDYGPMRPHTFNNLPGDRRQVQSAQMFHYKHQRQQLLLIHKLRESPKVPDSGASTDEENDEGDFTFYECPGLAPSGEMEVKNPLFNDSTLSFHKCHK